MHSLLIVVGDKPLHEMMLPYSENLQIPEYVYGPVSDWDKSRFLEYYGKEDGGILYTMDDFDRLYSEKGESWNGNRWKKAPNGGWIEMSTLNPDAHWDWYEVGGRWAGWLKLKDGVERMAPLNFSWGWDKDLKERTEDEKPCRADMAYLKDIDSDYLNIMRAGDLLINDEWIELGSYEFELVKPHLEGLPGDTLITCVDYHF